MLTVSNLTKSFGGRLLFENAGLQVNGGDRVGLIGPNGAGKSTLFALILNECQPDAGNVSLQKGTRVGFLPQESAPSGDETVLELAAAINGGLAAALETLRKFPAEDTPQHHHAHDRFVELDGYAVEAKAKRILAGLAFKEADFGRPARTLSGGWIMRAHLARLLVMEPELLMLDEPTNHLDLESLEWFQNTLANYPGAILTISHDRAFLNSICRTIVEIARRQLVKYSGNYDDFLRQKQAREGQYAAAYKNQQREIERLEAFVRRFRAKASKAAQAQERIKRLDKMERLAPPESPEATVHFRFPQPPRSGQHPVLLRDVRQAYGDHVVYERLNLTLERGQRTVLVGPNGAGKSTLLKILAGNVPLLGGERVVGHNVGIGYFAQQRREMLEGTRTVLEEALEHTRGVPEQMARTVLGSFLFRGDDVFKPVGVLSGGEKSRLALVKLLLDPPNLLLMDEPTTHLDIPSTDALLAALQQYSGTLLFVSHDVHFIRSIASTVLHIHSGRLTPYAGDYGYYLEKTRASSESGALVARLEDHRPPAAADPGKLPTRPPAQGLKAIREQRRTEAEARKAKAKADREHTAALHAVEARIIELEARQSQLASELEIPSSPSAAYASNLELIEIAGALEAANAQWESLAQRAAESA